MDDIVLPLPQTYSLNFDDIRRGSRKVEEVVTDFYAMLRPSLLSYVYYLVGSTRDSEDLVQVAFLQLFDQLNQGTEIRNLRGWLYRVVHNLAIEARPQDGQEGVTNPRVVLRPGEGDDERAIRGRRINQTGVDRKITCRA